MNLHAPFAIVLLFFVGMFLDHRFHTGYLFTILGIFLSIIYIGYEIWKAVNKNE